MIGRAGNSNPSGWRVHNSKCCGQRPGHFVEALDGLRNKRKIALPVLTSHLGHNHGSDLDARAWPAMRIQMLRIDIGRLPDLIGGLGNALGEMDNARAVTLALAAHDANDRIIPLIDVSKSFRQALLDGDA